VRLERPPSPPHFICVVVGVLSPAFVALGHLPAGATPPICIQGLGQPLRFAGPSACRPVTQCSAEDVAQRTPGPSWAAATRRGGLLMLSTEWVPPGRAAGCFV
jgi:hypothetical protein